MCDCKCTVKSQGNTIDDHEKFSPGSGNGEMGRLLLLNIHTSVFLKFFLTTVTFFEKKKMFLNVDSSLSPCKKGARVAQRI